MITYTATCLFGLESLLGEEIDALGYRRTLTMDGRIHFEGDEKAAASVSRRGAVTVSGRYPLLWSGVPDKSIIRDASSLKMKNSI